MAGGAAGLVAIGVAWWLTRPSGGAASGPRSDSVGARVEPVRTSPAAAPAGRRATGPVGRLRLLTTPPDAEIVIDGRRVGVGFVFDQEFAAGARRLEVRAQGYDTFDTTVVVQPGRTLSLGRVTLRSRGRG